MIETPADLDEAIKAAMKAKDTVRRDVLRLVKAELMNRQIALGRDATADDLRDVLVKEVKKREEAIGSVEGREDQYRDFLAQQRAELAILREYLPAPLSEDELRSFIHRTLTEAGLTSRKDMGAAMKLIMSHVKGRADGKLVNRLVGEFLR